MANEKVFLGRVQKLYRIVIPKAIREVLQIKVGDFVWARVSKEEGED